MNIKEILQHRHELGLTRAQTATAVGVSTGTVSHILERASAAGLSWPLPDGLDDEALRARLYPSVARDAGCVQPDWEAVLAELSRKRKRRRTRVTRRQLWVEYRDEARAQGATAYSYSRFCALLAERLDGEGRKAQMRFDYEPGLWGLSDFSGKTLALRTGRGETDVELFVAVLAHSQMIYAEAVPDQSVRHWTMVHRRALEYYGGGPSRWIIDNLKAGVHKADREEPQLNASFREFAQHYNVAVLPARSGRPTDKGLVESAVGAVQTRILLALRHETFFSLDAMNAAIRRELDRLNAAPMASGSTRRAVFEATERPALQALPAHPWEWGEWVERKVGPNGHVRVEHNHYSVPEGHIGHRVAARLGERMVEVFLERAGERIAVHRRLSGRNQYAPHSNHMPERLKAVRDIRRPDYGDILLARARRIGRNALAWAERCFASRDFPEQAFATVQGMVRLADDHGRERIDALCAEALDLIERMLGLGLTGMAEALTEQRDVADIEQLGFDDRLAMLIEREAEHRDHRSYLGHLRQAQLRMRADIHDVDCRAGRGIARTTLTQLAAGDWIRQALNLIVEGQTGSGKTFLACALAHQACRQKRSVLYRRVPELVGELSRARDTGRHDRLMRRLAKVELLVLDDWGLQSFSAEGRRDLLKIVEQRYGRKSIVVATQTPVERWPRIIGEATIADAVLDRIVHNAYRIELTGESQRKRNKPPPLDGADPEPTKR